MRCFRLHAEGRHALRRFESCSCSGCGVPKTESQSPNGWRRVQTLETQRREPYAKISEFGPCTTLAALNHLQAHLQVAGLPPPHSRGWQHELCPITFLSSCSRLACSVFTNP